MENFWKVLPFIAPIPLWGLIVAIAKLTPEEAKRAKMIGFSFAVWLLACWGMVYFGLQCWEFAVSDAPMTRIAIALFVVNFMNLMLCWFSLIGFLKLRQDFNANAQRREAEKRLKDLDDQLTEAREKRLTEHVKANTEERLAAFASALLNRSRD